MAFVALGVTVAFAPRSWLTVMTDVQWQQSMISLTALAGAGLAGGVPWASESGGRIAMRAHGWALVFAVTATVYVVSLSPVALIAAFMSGFSGMLDVWMARAEIASTSLRSNLERGERRSAA